MGERGRGVLEACARVGGHGCGAPGRVRTRISAVCSALRARLGGVDERCSNCGHTSAARCSDCGREYVCGRVSVPCPREGCPERIIDARYGDVDLSGGPVEERGAGPKVLPPFPSTRTDSRRHPVDVESTVTAHAPGALAAPRPLSLGPRLTPPV